MRNRSDDSGYGLFRQLQLVESEAEGRVIIRPLLTVRTRIPRTPPKATTRIRFEREVRISPSLDGSPGAEREIPAIGAERALFNRLAVICEKIASGHYNRPEVLDAVAQRIVASGELGNPNNDR